MLVTDAYKQCEDLIKQHSTSFYKGFSVLPKEKRKAVWAVYAFCRIVDDLVDEASSVTEAKEELARFFTEFEGFLKGDFNQNQFMWVALHHVFVTYEMDSLPFYDLIRGQQQDLWKTRYETMAELEEYCYYVAGTVGLMLLPILAPEADAEVRHKAVRLGIALQLTNILRDVKEDYINRGRVYLPQEYLRTYNFREEEILVGVESPNWKGLFDAITDRAERDYEEGLSGLMAYPKEVRLAVLSSALIYREILQEAKRRHGDIFRERVIVPNWRKALLMKDAMKHAIIG